MTPKEQYEARKAERKKRREAREVLGEHDNDALDIVDALDRMATAFERIADALIAKQ
jgi:hypothetical protein